MTEKYTLTAPLENKADFDQAHLWRIANPQMLIVITGTATLGLICIVTENPEEAILAKLRWG